VMAVIDGYLFYKLRKAKWLWRTAPMVPQAARAGPPSTHENS